MIIKQIFIKGSSRKGTPVVITTGGSICERWRSYLIKAWLIAKPQETTEEHPLIRNIHGENEGIPLRDIEVLYLKQHRRIDKWMINYSV